LSAHEPSHIVLAHRAPIALNVPSFHARALADRLPSSGEGSSDGAGKVSFIDAMGTFARVRDR